MVFFIKSVSEKWALDFYFDCYLSINSYIWNAASVHWITTADTILRGSSGESTYDTAMEILIAVDDIYPTCSTIQVSVHSKDSDCSFKCKDGVGETAEWINRTDCPYNMHIYTVYRSYHNNRRAATKKEKKKAKSVMRSVLSNMKSRKGMTSQKIRDEVINRLERSGLKWMWIGVRRGDGYFAENFLVGRHVERNDSNYNIMICLGD